MEKELQKGGEICRSIRKELAKMVVPGTKILGVAEWIEGKIREQGAQPTFPVNISINEIAAHFSPPPGYTEEFKEGQMVKIDFGAHIDGWPTDNAITFDLGDNESLLQASKDGLAAASEVITSRGPEATLSEIGSAIEKAIKGRDFQPIVNLTGHSMSQWMLHAGLSIHNFDTGSDKAIGEGLFAVEPFATTGSGRVKNGSVSEIYRLQKAKKQRLPNIRRLVGEIGKFKTFPFCSRWVSQPEYLNLLVKDGTLHNYPLLVEVSKGKVSQAEHTFLVKESGVEVVT